MTLREAQQRALEALIVLAIEEGPEEDWGKMEDLPELTEEEKAAMRSLGQHFVKRLLNKEF